MAVCGRSLPYWAGVSITGREQQCEWNQVSVEVGWPCHTLILATLPSQ